MLNAPASWHHRNPSRLDQLLKRCREEEGSGCAGYTCVGQRAAHTPAFAMGRVLVAAPECARSSSTSIPSVAPAACTGISQTASIAPHFAVCSVWTAVCGVQYVVCSVWTAVCAVQSVQRSVCSAVCGVQCAECRAWTASATLQCGLHTAKPMPWCGPGICARLLSKASGEARGLLPLPHAGDNVPHPCASKRRPMLTRPTPALLQCMAS